MKKWLCKKTSSKTWTLLLETDCQRMAVIIFRFCFIGVVFSENSKTFFQRVWKIQLLVFVQMKAERNSIIQIKKFFLIFFYWHSCQATIFIFNFQQIKEFSFFNHKNFLLHVSKFFSFSRKWLFRTFLKLWHNFLCTNFYKCP